MVDFFLFNIVTHYRSGVFKLPLKLIILFFALLFVQLLGDLDLLSWFSTFTGSLTTAVWTLTFVVATRLKGRFHRRVFCGLLTLMAGRIGALYMVSSSEIFLYGMICHAISYLFFISAFYLDFRSAPELDKKGARTAILIALISSFVIYLSLRPFLGVYRIPALIYTFVLSLLAMMASFRRLRVNAQSFVLILFGTGVFIASDVLFAINKFASPFEGAGYVVEGTHLLALYLIVAGGVSRVLQPNNSLF